MRPSRRSPGRPRGLHVSPRGATAIKDLLAQIEPMLETQTGEPSEVEAP